MPGRGACALERLLAGGGRVALRDRHVAVRAPLRANRPARSAATPSPTCQRARCQRITGTGGRGSSCRRSVDDGRVHAAALERAQRGPGRGRDREQAARTEPVEHRLGDAERGVATRDDDAGRARAGEQPQPARARRRRRAWPSPRRRSRGRRARRRRAGRRPGRRAAARRRAGRPPSAATTSGWAVGEQLLDASSPSARASPSAASTAGTLRPASTAATSWRLTPARAASSACVSPHSQPALTQSRSRSSLP